MKDYLFKNSVPIPFVYNLFSQRFLYLLKSNYKGNSRGSDFSNFIGSDQKVAPYHLVVSQVMKPKSDFLLIEVGAITPKWF